MLNKRDAGSDRTNVRLNRIEEDVAIVVQKRERCASP